MTPTAQRRVGGPSAYSSASSAPCSRRPPTTVITFCVSWDISRAIPKSPNLRASRPRGRGNREGGAVARRERAVARSPGAVRRRRRRRATRYERSWFDGGSPARRAARSCRAAGQSDVSPISAGASGAVGSVRKRGAIGRINPRPRRSLGQRAAPAREAPRGAAFRQLRASRTSRRSRCEHSRAGVNTHAFAFQSGFALPTCLSPPPRTPPPPPAAPSPPRTAPRRAPRLRAARRAARPSRRRTTRR